MDKQFHSTRYDLCNYFLSMLRFKLNHVKAGGGGGGAALVGAVCELHIDGLVQERRSSSALALELCLSCTNQSISNFSRHDAQLQTIGIANLSATYNFKGFLIIALILAAMTEKASCVDDDSCRCEVIRTNWYLWNEKSNFNPLITVVYFTIYFDKMWYRCCVEKQKVFCRYPTTEISG